MADPCDVCGAAGRMTPLVEAGLPGVGPVRIHRCGGCGLRQVRPRLSPAALEALYDADYFDPAAAHGFAGYARQRQRYERDAFFLARELRRLAPAGRFLEVGSALGFLLAALAPGTRWEVEGVEVSAFGAWYARDRFGARVHAGTLEEAALPAEAFDYVLQKDLLEHVTHPRRHLEETRRIMRRGARLRVVTPNGEADVRPLQRAAAGRDGGDLPVLGQGHLSFFSRGQTRPASPPCRARWPSVRTSTCSPRNAETTRPPGPPRRPAGRAGRRSGLRPARREALRRRGPPHPRHPGLVPPCAILAGFGARYRPAASAPPSPPCSPPDPSGPPRRI